MEICVEGRHKADIRVLYQKANKLRYEIDAKIDSIDITSDEITAEKLITQAKTSLQSYGVSLAALQTEIQSQPPEDEDEWNSKLKKLVQYESAMKSRLQKVVYLRSEALRKSNGYHRHAKRDEEDESGLKKLVEEKEGLEQSRKIAIEIQNYGAMVWNSIKQQSGRLQGIFSRTGQMNDGIDFSHTLANTLFRKTKTDCYIFVGLALLTIALIVVCFYYVKPWLFG